MKQRWTKKQVQEKVSMFMQHYIYNGSEDDLESWRFFMNKLVIMELNGYKTLTIEL